MHEKMRIGRDAEQQLEFYFKNHRELTLKLLYLEEWIYEPAGEGDFAKGLRERLCALSATLQVQFAEEEDGVLFSSASIRAPEYSLRIDDLMREHDDFLRELESLEVATMIVAPMSRSDRKDLAHRVRQLVLALRKHEVEENEILQRVFTGTGE